MKFKVRGRKNPGFFLQNYIYTNIYSDIATPFPKRFTEEFPIFLSDRHASLGK